jgi:type IV secretion system protein VirB4
MGIEALLASRSRAERVKDDLDPRRKVADLLPWAAIVGPGAVLCKDGSFLRFATYSGPDLDSLTDAERDAFGFRVSRLVARLGTGYAAWAEILKHEAEPYPESAWPCEAAGLIDAEFREGYGKAGNRFISRYYFVIHYLPPPEEERKIAAFFIKNATRKETNYADVLKLFIETTDTWFALAKKSLPQFRALGDDELYTYLCAMVGEQFHERRLPGFGHYLDYLAASVDITPGHEPKIGARHLRSISLRAFPHTTIMAVLAAVDHLAIEMRFSTRWIGLDRGDAASALTRIRTKWYSKRNSAKQLLTSGGNLEETRLQNPEAMLRTDEANAALSDLAEARSSQGLASFTFIVSGATASEADERAKAVIHAVDGCGFVAKVETFNAFDAWRGTLPGNARANVRQPLISSVNFAHMAPLTSIWPGDATNTHWNGPALIYAKTAGAATFRVNLHVGDVGHTLILGKTGAGKSFCLNTIIAQALRYPGIRIVGIDKDGSSRATTLSMGGHFHDLSNRNFAGFQPLRNIHIPEVRDWAQRWLELICEKGLRQPLTAKQASALTNALDGMAGAPLDSRTLGLCRAFVQDSDLKIALDPYCDGGPYAYLFDRAGEYLQDHFWQVFELGAIHENRTLAQIVTHYLYHRMDRLFSDARPTIFFVEEAWVYFDDEEEAPRLKQRLVTLRKFNVLMIFITQNPADIQRSAIASAVFQSVATKILLPNPGIFDLTVRPIYEQLGLNARQLQILQEAAQKSDYYLINERGARLFSLPVGPITKILCGTTDREDHPMIDEILESGSKQPFHRQLLARKGVILPEEIAA